MLLDAVFVLRDEFLPILEAVSPKKRMKYILGQEKDDDLPLYLLEMEDYGDTTEDFYNLLTSSNIGLEELKMNNTKPVFEDKKTIVHMYDNTTVQMFAHKMDTEIRYPVINRFKQQDLMKQHISVYKGTEKLFMLERLIHEASESKAILMVILQKY